jgi:hypothetical protein
VLEFWHKDLAKKSPHVLICSYLKQNKINDNNKTLFQQSGERKPPLSTMRKK